MKLSDDRINHISHKIADLLADDELVEFSAGRNEIRLSVKRIFTGILKADDELERKAAEKVRSLKRGVAEGGPEWDILVYRYYEEEIDKLRSIR